MINLGKLAEIVRALSNPMRLVILRLLVGRELCVCQLKEILPISQSAVSQHLTILKRAGFIKSRRKGQWVYYTANAKEIDRSISSVQGFFLTAPDEIPEVKEYFERLEHLPTCEELHFRSEKHKRG